MRHLEISHLDLKATVKRENALLIDLRHQDDFVQGYIPDSIFVGIDGPFEKWIQEVVSDKAQFLVLVMPVSRETEIIKKFNDLGYQNIIGYLKGGFDTWLNHNKDISTINSISATQFKETLPSVKQCVFDVRKTSEYDTAHIDKTNLVPLVINDEFVNHFPMDKECYLYCGGGYRSVIAASFLKLKAEFKIVNVTGGFGAIKKSGITIVV